MVIQKFKKSRLDSCVDLFHRVFTGPPWNDKWPSHSHVKAYLEDIVDAPGFIGILGFEKESLTGMLLGNIRRWYSGDQFWIYEFCIDNNFQRKGLGTQMVSFLKSELSRENVFSIALLTERESAAAAFYEKKGFRSNQKLTLMSMRLER
jgi:aminoglycoside 6'-N-acetyltransferase I